MLRPAFAGLMLATMATSAHAISCTDGSVDALTIESFERTAWNNGQGVTMLVQIRSNLPKAARLVDAEINRADALGHVITWSTLDRYAGAPGAGELFTQTFDVDFSLSSRRPLGVVNLDDLAPVVCFKGAVSVDGEILEPSAS